jgi:hypothetical protein
VSSSLSGTRVKRLCPAYDAIVRIWRFRTVAHAGGCGERGDGARLAVHGSLPADPRLAGGFFVPPAVLADVTPGMVVAQEEICGPVACIVKYDTEDEAVAIANGTAYGLTCAGLSSARASPAFSGPERVTAQEPGGRARGVYSAVSS